MNLVICLIGERKSCFGEEISGRYRQIRLIYTQHDGQICYITRSSGQNSAISELGAGLPWDNWGKAVSNGPIGMFLGISQGK